jgi:arylsulfatase A-like enzyme
MNDQPNFLLIITDQQQASHLGCYGNRIVRTPHVDALAARGVRAERCHVASPICMPNRASLMTGRMPSVHGVRHNGIELSHGETTFVDVLREAGWRTAIAGKSHLQCIHEAPAQVPPDPKSRLAREARRKVPGRYSQELDTAWEKNPAHDLTYPYYGFERAHLTIQHGDTQYGHWRRWLRTQTRDADRLIGPENALPTPEFELNRCRQAWRTRVPEELYPNAWVTDRTIDLLREFARDEKPFFIQCSYPDPHHPFTPPGQYWSMYSPDDVPAPPSFHAEHRNLPPHVQWLHAMRDAGKAVKHTQAPFACSEREAREAIALNYGTISQIDDGVGRVVAELERLGLDRNTIVLFTSDHGDFMGDHQLLLKGPIHYRGLIRVPLIWKDPRGPSGRTMDALVQTTDLAPTILERAGVAPWNGIQGISLLAAFADERKAPYESLLIEEEGQRVYLGFSRRVRMRSLVTRSHRLSVYDGGDWGELYDFADDPLECVNRWDDRGSGRVRAELVEQLAHRMLDYAETSPYPDYIA